MRRHLTLILLLLISTLQISKGEIVKNLKKDFGALGDGKKNDSKAWADALAYFSGKSNGKLVIPKGIYRIGEQKIDTILGNKVLFANLKFPANLKNATNIIFEGEVDPTSGKSVSILKNIDGLYYGYIDPVTKKEVRKVDVESEANIGAMLNMNFTCKDIIVRNIELDGNIDQHIYYPIPKGLKKGGDIGHYGITSYAVQNLLIENVYAHHFALDGFYVQNDRKVLDEGKYHTIVRNCRSDFNGRQGISFTVGSSLLLVNSEFTNTGRGRIRISPASNIDIENHDRSGAPLQRIRIDSCIIRGNVGGTGSINIAGKVKDLQITNSIIDVGIRPKEEHQGYSITSMYSPNKDLLVKNSLIKGKMMLYSKDKITAREETTLFENCEIIDSDLRASIPKDQYLIDAYEGVEFRNSKIYLSPSRQLLRVRDTGGKPVVTKNNSVFKLTELYERNSKKKLKFK